MLIISPPLTAGRLKKRRSPIERASPGKRPLLVMSVPVGPLPGIAAALPVEYVSQIVTTPRDPAGIEVVHLETVLR